MLNVFAAPPDPLTPRQRTVLFGATLLIAASRLYALSRTLWDWDEAQFASALREYDVSLHHPHPPGFPLFILAAHVARLFTSSDFVAIRTVSLVAACLLFPLAFLLARECRFDLTTSFAGAVLFAFLPNIWFYGGTAFSDITGLAFVLGACAVLLRGCRDPRALLGGAVLLGMAAGFRPQALLFGAAPFLLAAWLQWRRSWRTVAGAALLAAAVVTLCYAGAAAASASFEGYRIAIRFVGEWVRHHDAFTAASRPALGTLFDEFIVHPIAGGRLTLIVFMLALTGLVAGIVRRRAAVIVVAASFLPFMAFAWLMLDINSVHRYATSYLFLHALLAAEGVGYLCSWLPRRAAAAQTAVLLLIAARFAWWTVPALDEVRTAGSPTAQALAFLQAHVPPAGRVWVDGSMAPFASYGLRDRDARVVQSIAQVPFVPPAVGDFFVTEGDASGEVGVRFVRARGRVWQIARHRYFDTTVVPVGSLARFGDGWYGEEGGPEARWRWMAARGDMVFPAVGGKARLRLDLASPEGSNPVVEVQFNGAVIDRLQVTPDGVRLDRVVDSRSDRENVLTLTADRTVNPSRLGGSDDDRELAVRLEAFAWQPLRR